MSYQSFQLINAWIKDHAENQTRRRLQNMLVALGGASGVMQSLASEYARRYALVQRLKYDSEGEPSDVTPPEQITVPDNVFANAVSSLKTLLSRADDIVPVVFETPIVARANGCVSVRSAMGNSTGKVQLRTTIVCNDDGDPRTVKVDDESVNYDFFTSQWNPADNDPGVHAGLAYLNVGSGPRAYIINLTNAFIGEPSHPVRVYIAGASNSTAKYLLWVDHTYNIYEAYSCSDGTTIDLSSVPSYASSSFGDLVTLVALGYNAAGNTWVGFGGAASYSASIPDSEHFLAGPAAQPTAVVANVGEIWDEIRNSADDVTSALQLLESLQD